MRRRAQRVELDVEVPVVSDRLSQCGRTDDGRNIVNRPGGRGSRRHRRYAVWRFGSRQGLDFAGPDALEEGSGLRIDTRRVELEALVEIEEVPGVRAVEGAEVAHYQSTHIAWKDPSGPAQGWHNTEPASLRAPVIMARGVQTHGRHRSPIASNVPYLIIRA